MATEEFSFPAIGETNPCSIDSPPLWNLSPAASPNSYHIETEKEEARKYSSDSKEDKEDCFAQKLNKYNQRHSFSCVENSLKGLGGDDEEDKMDLLWEDFNEELSSTTGSATTSSRDMVELGCVQALTMSKTSGAGFSNRKPAGMVILKVLKKLFLLHNSHLKTKKSVRQV
ncbi:Glutamate-1-semialdehyde 2,1-aminomutase 1 [Quillaja saponaria]|uniref:Glutamate-1-semialdehyde 2,1-aminomutase 1 n=1 Tax=Quillaja saponaria TaxID=32244 RepID=A0AAD7VFN8_QUISA|nr:Glutamate-1-semialdehyde 2,1-aminomutase 1 [Quillaja saponaria]